MPNKRDKSSVPTEDLIKNINEIKKKIQLSGKYSYVFNNILDVMQHFLYTDKNNFKNLL